jgi:RNA polymerase primary sigma factor
MNNKNRNKFTNNPGESYSPLAQLIALGREKSYITDDDILHFFPKPEQDMEQLDRIFATLESAGIPYVEEDQSDEE